MNQFVQDAVVCPHCGAENTPYSKNCWICHRDLAAGGPVTAEIVQAQRPPFAPADATFMVLTLALAGALVMSVVGMWQEQPGIAIGLIILLAPVFIATVIRSQSRRARKGFLTWKDRFVLLGSSLIMTIAAISLVLFSAIVALFLICLGSMPFWR